MTQVTGFLGGATSFTNAPFTSTNEKFFCNGAWSNIQFKASDLPSSITDLSCGTAFVPANKADLQTAVDECIAETSDGSCPIFAASTWSSGLEYGSIGLWNISKVTSLESLFEGKTEFNQDLSAWDVSKVTTLESTFLNAHVFNSNISAWDVSKVDSLVRAFNGANAFNSDISTWDVSKVTMVGNMFHTNMNHFIQGVWCSFSWNQHRDVLSLPPGNRVFCCNPGRFLNDSDPLAKVNGSWTFPNAEACPKCPVGQYTDTLNLNTQCTPAARDEFVPAQGMNSASKCSDKSYTNPPNTALC